MPTASHIRRMGATALVCFIASLLLPSSLLAQTKKRFELTQSVVSATALKPGMPAMAAIVVDIKPGFHAQSNTPTQDYLIPFSATVEPTEGIKAGNVLFPKPELKEYKALGKLSVFDGQVVLRVPLEVAADAKPGPITIKGTLGFQICDDKTCFAPEEVPFEIQTSIADAAAEVKPANDELFKGYLATPTTGATSKPRDPSAKVTVDAVLSSSAVEVGKPATIAVVLDIVPGFYAQANASSGDVIPTTVAMDPADGLKFGEAKYPPGQSKESALGTLSVYRSRAIILVPVEATSQAKAGADVKLSGQVTVQVCDDKGICLPPRDLPFEINTKVAGARETVTANQPELFEAAAAMTATTTRGAPSAKPPAGPAAGDSTANTLKDYSLLSVFGIAFVVGIIFNIVPCVLPVLPLKAIGFYETAQHDRLKSVSYGAVFSLGVIASFAMLGLLVVVLRAFTWGEIFSNPWFSMTLVIILVAMAANMFGLFTVNLPTGVYAFSPRHDTYFGNFLFGILTAALSTPCTFGLFVSILVYALTVPPTVGLLLVSTVGAGMASPYLVLSAMPEVARKFPRTGPWAELVKQSMGFLLLGVAVFFAKPWLDRVLGSAGVWWLIFTIVAAGGLFVIAKSFKYGKTMTAPVVGIAVALLLVVPTFYIVRELTLKPYVWQPYTPESLSAARTSNQIVLVEFTADWCTNCHALEAFVLNTKEIQRSVRDHSVTMIKADLSAKNAPGWTLLKDNLKAEGVPLTVIYSPQLTEPIQLTGFYKTKDLKAAIERASRAQTAMR